MLIQRTADRLVQRQAYTFCFFWIVTFLLYLPAARAGFVSDTTGWFQSLTEDSFGDYINRTRFSVKSMYQLTQFNTWLIYQVAGIHQWAWHLVHVTLHATVCLLLYKLCRKLFEDSGVNKPYLPALAGTFLFCVSPYASEVVVWEASFHYMQALLFIFGILLLVQRFQHSPAAKTAIWACFIFFLSTFTHELFYLSPILTLSLAFYYRIVLHKDKRILRQTLLLFTLPQILLFVAHLLSFRLVYGNGVAHIGSQLFNSPIGYFLVKPPWCFFHVFAWGRFFPREVRMAVYDVFRTTGGAIAFYGLLLFVCTVILVRFRKMDRYWQLVSFLFLWLLIAQAILVPLWFPENLLVVGDRYLYLMLAFHGMLVALLLYKIKREWLKQGLLLMVAFISIYWNLKLSKKWYESERVIRAIQTSPLIKPGKVKVLLNSPACIKGIPMIGATAEGEFLLMHNLFFKPAIKDTMLEVAAYNMISPEDGAHVEVMNDSMVKVTLNQWGTWWWRNGDFGATSYENEWFRLDLVDPGHWYYLILKQPAANYDLFYQKGEEIKVVDMAIRGAEQN